MQHRIIIAAATALLAGCAAPPNPPAPQASAAPQPSLAQPQGAPVSAGASQFDGVYRGTVSVVNSGGYGARCGVGGDASVTVRDGVVRRRWGGNLVEAAVQPDGSFSTGSGARMHGQITGQSMDLEISRPACMQHYRLARS